MRVLLNHSKAKSLHKKYWDHVGVLFSPERKRFYPTVPYAIDNGAYGAWLKGEDFNAGLFQKVLHDFSGKGYKLFAVCPDKVNDRAATMRMWDTWHPLLLREGWPSAFVFTNGMTIEDIPDNADYVFIGGDNEFKEWAITQIPRIKQPVHVGRVNHHSRLWKSHNYGAFSCDGTGWFRGDKHQEGVLMDYLAIKQHEAEKETGALFHIGHYCA